MSRSYRRYPCIKDKNPGYQKIANRKIRRIKGHLPSGSYYQKLFRDWVIEWRFYGTYADALQRKYWEYKYRARAIKRDYITHDELFNGYKEEDLILPLEERFWYTRRCRFPKSEKDLTLEERDEIYTEWFLMYKRK